MVEKYLRSIQTGSSWLLGQSLKHLPQHAYDTALDTNVAGVDIDRIHRGVGWLELDAIALFVELLERDGVFVFNSRSHHLTVLRSAEHTSELQSLRHLVCRPCCPLFAYTTLFRSLGQSLKHLPQHAYDTALDTNVAGVDIDRIHRGVGWLELDAIALFVELLERDGVFVFNSRSHHLTVL